MTDILSLTAVELGKKIAAGEITSVEATKAYLNRIGEADKEIHAYITIEAEKALEAAREADRRLQQENLQVLLPVFLLLSRIICA